MGATEQFRTVRTAIAVFASDYRRQVPAPLDVVVGGAGQITVRFPEAPERDDHAPLREEIAAALAEALGSGVTVRLVVAHGHGRVSVL
jgi:hypothetical protein